MATSTGGIGSPRRSRHSAGSNIRSVLSLGHREFQKLVANSRLTMRRECTVELFGGPQVRDPRGEIARLTPYQRALVAFVLANRRTTRPKVAEVLWGGDATPQTRHRIRQVLHSLRMKLPADAMILACGDELSTAPSVVVDVDGLSPERLRSRFPEAALMVQKGFLSQLPRITPSFDRWRDRFELTARTRIMVEAKRAWTLAHEGSCWDLACDAAEALFILNRDDPECASRLIIAKARIGRLGAAEGVFEEFVHRGADPEDRARVESALETARYASDVPGLSIRSDPDPFVGRDAELAALGKLTRRVNAGGCAFAMVTGEAGIGKRRRLG